MRALTSHVDYEAHRRDLASCLQDDDYLIFLDTNILAWSFRLNTVALKEFVSWLRMLIHGARLAIPAWVIHEYNHHLRAKDATFFTPHRAATKALAKNLDALEKNAHLLIEESTANVFGSRANALSKIDEASSFLRKVSRNLTRDEAERHRTLASTWEDIISRAGLQTDITALAKESAAEIVVRQSNRLSPGYQDAHKVGNAAGDLIIWKELLACCTARSKAKAILLTNDSKSDWVYTPASVTLVNGKSVDGSSEAARNVMLPAPELLTEFVRAVGRYGQLRITTIELVVELLSSSKYNPLDVHCFRNLALATKSLAARTPTEELVFWFLAHPHLIEEAIGGVCRWEHSPSEVDFEAFERWVVERNPKLNPSDIRWGTFFASFFSDGYCSTRVCTESWRV